MALTTPPGVAPTAAQRRKARAENARRKREEARQAAAALRKQRLERTRPTKRQKFQGRTTGQRAIEELIGSPGQALLATQQERKAARIAATRDINPMALGYNAPQMDVAQEYRRVLAEQGEDAAGDFLRRYAPERTGMASFLEMADIATGIPSFIKDPGLLTGLGMAASVVPVKGLGKVAGLASSAAKSPVRRLAASGAKALVPAAGSRTGRLLEGAWWKVTPEKRKLTVIGREAARTAKTQTTVQLSPGKALARVGKVLGADEQTALRLVAEGVPLDEQVAFYRAQGQVAKTAGDAQGELFHGIHENLIEQARKYLVDTPTGPVLRPDAPKSLQKAWQLLEKTAGTREDIYRELGLLTDDTIKRRIGAPGRVVRGELGASDRLAEIERQIEGWRKRVYDALRSQYGGGEAISADQARFNRYGSRRERMGKKSSSDQLWEETDRAIDRMLSLNSDDPMVVRAKALFDERDVLRARLAGTADDPFGLVEKPQLQGITGKAYVPSKRGTPGVGKLRPRDLSRQAQAFVAGGYGKSVGGAVKDPSLRNAYKGALMLSGGFRTDVTRLSSESLAKAVKLANTKNVHARLLDMAVDAIPPGKTLDDYIAIKVNPTINASDKARRFWDKYQDLQNLPAKELEAELGRSGVDDELKALVKDVFSGEMGDPNVKWVPRQVVDAAMFNPVFNQIKWESFGTRGAGKIAGRALDAFNDWQRFTTLYLNPAYGFVNLIGNEVMALMQQGVFHPRNIVRSFQMSRSIKPENLAAAHELMQSGGISRALGRSPAEAAKQVTGKVADAFSAVVDRGPRWTAFVHELDKVGIKTPKQLDDLIDSVRAGDENALTQLDVAKRKANDALVDFERMSPFEQHVMSRIVFFYPWIRGASRWAVKFPLEHPVQAGAIGYAGYKAHEYADEVMGERPWYAQFDVPVPGWTDENGNPVVMSPRQLLTALTPIETLATPVAAAMGVPGASQLGESGTPLVQAGIALATGRNQYGAQVGAPQALLDTAKEFVSPFRLYEGLTGDQEGRVYQRPGWMRYARLPGGGLSPKVYNVEAGSAQASGKTKDEREDEAQLAYVQDPANGFSPKAREDYARALEQRADLDEAAEGKKPKEKALIAAALWIGLHPEAAEGTDKYLVSLKTDAQYQAFYNDIRGWMFADLITAIESAIPDSQE